MSERVKEWIEDNQENIKFIVGICLVITVAIVIAILILPNSKDRITVLEIAETDGVWRVVYDSTSDYSSNTWDEDFNTLEGALRYAELKDKKFYKEWCQANE